MRFQIGTDGKHPFLHGHFFDENGHYFWGEGIDHLSDNFFCQADAAAFLYEAAEAGKITFYEACALRRDQALLSLPEERPSNLLLYQKNEKARIARMVTKEGLKQLAIAPEPKYSWKRFMVWLSRCWDS